MIGIKRLVLIKTYYNTVSYEFSEKISIIFPFLRTHALM